MIPNRTELNDPSIKGNEFLLRNLYDRLSPEGAQARERANMVMDIAMTILGYIPVVSTVSGSVRMFFGAVRLIKSREDSRFSSSEAVYQIGRGALEVLLPAGWAVKLVVDLCRLNILLVSNRRSCYS